MDVPVLNMKGDEVSMLTIDESALGGTINPGLIKQAYVRYHANRRQGSSRTKSRGMISGSTKKIYKQKGTGRARHGSKRVVQMRGGGVAFAKTRTHADFCQDMPKKMRRKANRNALLAKLIDGEVKVIDSLIMDTPKTRSFVDFLQAIGVDRNALIALSSKESKKGNVRLSSRNVEAVSTIRACDLNCFEMLNNRYLVIAKEDLEAWLTGPSSQIDKTAKTNPMGAAGGNV